MKKFYHQHQKKINYLLIGGWNTIFGYLTFVVLYYLLAQRIHYLILFVAANILSITNAYIGYKIFVFKTSGNYLKEYLRFYLVYGVSLLVNILLLPLAVEGLKVSPILAQGGLMFINVVFSYYGHKHVSFRAS